MNIETIGINPYLLLWCSEPEPLGEPVPFFFLSASNSSTKKSSSKLNWAWIAGEMVQQVRELVTKPGALSFILIFHTVEGQNSLPQAVPCATYHGTYIPRSHIQINKCKENWLRWLTRTLNCFILVKHSSKKQTKPLLNIAYHPDDEVLHRGFWDTCMLIQ